MGAPGNMGSPGLPDAAVARLRRLSNVRRARGSHLYCADGTRYLDLYRDGGRAILGHRAGAVVRERKNALERGLAADLPSPHERRLNRAVRRLFDEANVIRVYATRERAVAAVAAFLDRSIAMSEIVDPVVGAGETAALIWRPFLPRDLETLLDVRATPIFPVLPSPGETAQVVLFPEGDSPDSDIISASRLVSLERAIFDLVASRPIEPLPLPGFRAVGPYLVPAVDESVYNEWFNGFLAQGILISPDPNTPSISPGEISDGERQRTIAVAREIAGK